MGDDFEIVIAGTPVSNQARRRERLRTWIAQVADEVRRNWPSASNPWDGPVAIAITHYFAEVPIDLDNLPKPILDAMKGVAIVDDMQVVELLIRKHRAIDVRRAEGSALVAGALAT